MNNRRNIFIILFAFIFLISDTLTQSCGTPAECFSYAIGILERDRTEMRRQLDKYEELNANDKIFSYELTIVNFSDMDDMDYEDRYKMEDFNEPFVKFGDVFKI